VATGLAQRRRRRGRRDPCRVEIRGHQRRDGAAAQRCAGLEGAGNDGRGFARLGVAPLMQRVVGLTGAVDDPLDLALAVVEATRPRVEIDPRPRAGPDLTDPQPAPHHAPEQRAVAQPIDHPEPLAESIVVPRFGKTLRDDQLMPAPMNRWLGNQPPLVQAATATGHDAQAVIDRRGGEALAGGGEEPRLHIGGPGGRQILVETRLPGRGEQHAKAFQRVEGAGDGCRRLLPRLQVREVGGHEILTLRA
jgi:hypothetical protein